MLRVVAKHADQWNTFGTPELFRHKINVLGEHCGEVGRDLDEIEVSWAGMALVTDSKEAREQAVRGMAEAFGRPVEEVEPGLLVGEAQLVRDRIHRLNEAGVTHFILIANSPYNLDSIRRFAEEVMPEFRS
jgi:alkanesulfonate monooxygenase SsuD/methylene tetrahydromethanopterin reductase-like flavin-dependent oxidoreductase (luciferase family)